MLLNLEVTPVMRVDFPIFLGMSDNDEIAQLEMYGFIRNSHDTVDIANIIFETRLYNYF